MADALKDQGNKAFAAKDFDKAIDLFSQAIAIDPNNHVLFSNRSAAKAGKKLWEEALVDAEQCIKINTKWSKGYARKGAALHGAKRYDDAIATYQQGLDIDDNPTLRKGLKEVQDAKASQDGLGIGQLFADPNLLGKLAANPKTSKYLADPSFVQKLRLFQQNPSAAASSFQDPRMIEVMGVLMGIDISAATRPEGSTEMPQDFSPTSPPSQPDPPSSTSKPSSSSKVSEPEPPTESVEMEDENDDEVKAKREAAGLKNKASEHYRKREFPQAAQLYEQAWDVYPKDITFLTNLGAVYFEQGDYDKAIEACQKAVNHGRELHADYKLVAKAYGRIGSSHQKRGDLDQAIKSFQSSLTEHRTADILAKLKDAERAKSEAVKKAYINPELSHKAREEGNDQFKAGDFAAAVKSYSESIKRDPSDARGYNNRAAAYMKLAAFPEALKDTDEAIKVDSSFIKAYIRKASVLQAMREYTKALDVLQEADEKDADKKHTTEIRQLEIKCQQALYSQRAEETQEQTLERAMKDPEVAEIMSDPVMQSILQQAQSNPGALQDHMKNPVVRQKIQKLINAGIIRTR